MHTKVLIYSSDSLLLMTRRLLLEKAGFRVFTTMESSDAIELVMHQDIALLILCQSLRAEERQSVLAVARATHPTMKILMMRFRAALPVIEPQEAILDVVVGREVLLSTIQEMLGISADVSTNSQPISSR